MSLVLDLDRYHQNLSQMATVKSQGKVVQVIGLTIAVEGLKAQVGELCRIYASDGEGRPAEVVGFREGQTLLMPLAELAGVEPGSLVEASGSLLTVPAGGGVLGRVLDGLGRAIDGHGPLRGVRRYPISCASPHPLSRGPISQALPTGVRAVDALLTCGKGQRLGIFSASGVGKSTMLGMIARGAASDVNVIALIGERGREVNEFIERDLGKALERSVVVVSTSDEPALVRLKGAWVATTIAEYFREQGKDVVLLMDSVTRFAMAQREIGLSIGEPPAVKGYVPSVFALLPRLMERAGTSARGTITAFYTVLVESDDLTEPVSDTALSILDGHIILQRGLAAENHYPAIDILSSISRVMATIAERPHLEAANRLRQVVATYRNARDLVDIGAYVQGSNPEIDYALKMMPQINAFLRQVPDEPNSFPETVARLKAMFAS